MEFQDLAKAFGGNVVLDGVSASIVPGQFILLRGDNASGKTTLLNILTGQLEAERGRVSFRGSFGTKHIEFCDLRRRVLPKRPEFFAEAGIGRSWQEVRLFPNHSVLDNVAAAAPAQIGERLIQSVFLRKRVSCAEQTNRAASLKVLNDLRAGDVALRSPPELSLWKAKLVAIARAVHSGARVLFLDEPLAGLDEGGADDVLLLIQKLIRSQGISVVIVEHLYHLPKLLPRVDLVWTLSGGKLTTQAPSAVFEELRRSPNDLVDWFSQLASRGYQYSVSEIGHGARLHVARLCLQGPLVFAVNDLQVARHSGSGVTSCLEPGGHGFSVELRAGDVAFLEGPNGWGKTILLEAMAGLLPATSGSVLVDEVNVDELRSWERARLGVALLRSSGATFPSVTVAELFKLAGAPLPEFLQIHTRRMIGQLSGGQQQFVNVMRVLARKRARVRLFDECFNMLDRNATGQVKNAIIENVMACTLLAGPGAAPLDAGLNLVDNEKASVS